MAESPTPDIRSQIDDLYRTHSRQVFATLIRLLGDFDLAEEAMHDAFASAVEQWPREGVPVNCYAWLVSAGRFKGIDVMRRRARSDATLAERAAETERQSRESTSLDPDEIHDDRLRLIFTCCHPALPPESQVPLTLREVCGLTTEEIARVFFVSPATVAQRIVRAKAKIKSAGIPYHVPSQADMPERLDGVLHVIYLVFNEGYAASAGDLVTRSDLSGEAIRLGRLLKELLGDPEVAGLLGLMLLQESRRGARTSPAGDLVLLEDQDRTLWNRDQIAEGLALVREAVASGCFGPYTLQSAIAAVHAQADVPAATDWAQITALYDLLLRVESSPVVELNRAVAVAMRDGPAEGLRLIDAIMGRGDLVDYHLAHAARAELCRRLGKIDEAKAAFVSAIELVRQEPEKRFLERRLRDLSS